MLFRLTMYSMGLYCPAILCMTSDSISHFDVGVFCRWSISIDGFSYFRRCYQFARSVFNDCESVREESVQGAFKHQTVQADLIILFG